MKRRVERHVFHALGLLFFLESEENSLYLNALFDPEVAAHGLPVLRAAGVEQPLVHAPLHGGIKHLEELCSDERLGAAKARQEGWFQFGRDVTS